MSGRVLVIDDDNDIREVVALILEDAGYTATEADGGHAALALLRSGPPPDVILLDLMMPDMSGWDLCAELARDPMLAKIPVVVMSGDSRIQAKADTLAAAGYLAKPFDQAQLLSVLEALIRS
jgi:CheY-like chemotaxis protein